MVRAKSHPLRLAATLVAIAGLGACAELQTDPNADSDTTTTLNNVNSGSTRSGRGAINILAIGQSNMEGRYGPAQSVINHGRSMEAWDWKANGWVDAELGQLPFGSILGSAEPAHNLAFEFAQQLSSHCETDTNLVLLSSSGKRIEYFLPEAVLLENGWVTDQTDYNFGSSLSDEIFAQDGDAKTALSALNKKAFDVLLIHQGEGNFSGALDSVEDYTSKMRALIGALEDEVLIDESTPIVLGTINANYKGASQHAQSVLSLDRANLTVAEWDGIETVGDGNNHATGKGLQQLGIRFFEGFLRLDANLCQ